MGTVPLAQGREARAASSRPTFPFVFLKHLLETASKIGAQIPCLTAAYKFWPG